jgi:transmembrane sensor
MADGSKVMLNTDTQLRVAMTDEERRIDLKRGEAFFDVAKDPHRPFVVTAGTERVIAVGTKFAVRRDAGSVRVVVTEGAVRMETLGKDIVDARPLAAGTVARTSEAGLLLQTKPLPEAEEYLSWRDGVLVFRETTLANAIAEFNRYNTHKIVIEDAAVAEMRVAGNFRSTNVDAFVRLLGQGYPLRVERHHDKIVLKAN